MTLRTLLIVAVVACVTQCTPRVPSADPFAGETESSRERVRTYRIQLDVACEGCRINYSIGLNGASAVVDGSWMERTRVTPLAPIMVRLSATPEAGSGPIRGVRIQVDGETVAERGCLMCDPTSERMGRGVGSMTIEAVVPPRSRP